MSRRLATITLLVLFAAKAWAHPVPALTYDRTVRIRLTPTGVEATYRLELVDTTMLLDAAELITPEQRAALKPGNAIRDLFLEMIAPHLADRLDVWQDDKLLTFACVERKWKVDDHLYCDFTFVAPWAQQSAGGGRLRVSVRKPERQERIHVENGRLDLAFADEQGLTLTERSEPPAELKDRRDVNRTDADDARLREISAKFSTTPSTTSPAPETPAAPAEDRSIVTKMRRGGLTVLLDSELGLGLMLLLAGGFGAIHALTPGHGKTLVAAYLVGQRGTVGHAFLLGLVTTITHTGVVIILAALLPFILARVAPERVQAILGFGGGILIAGLGIWLLLRRLSGGADHVHIGGGHHHHHGPGGHHHHHFPPVADAPSSRDRVRVWDLVMLGISGGIVPCWDAIALLAMAIGTQRVWLGLPLLLAFSAGLAGVLVLIGVLVVKIKGFGSSRFGDGRIVRTLPILSAVVVTLLGIWLCIDAAAGN
jgi:ABC-type nickel/cobalt efflux system permease component RcnA